MIAIVAIAFSAGPTFAYRLFNGVDIPGEPNRFFNTSAIDTNLDGKFDLSVCYGSSLTDLIYLNRSALSIGIQEWAKASPGSFSSNANCNNDNSNIEIRWADLGTCSVAQGLHLGLTQPKVGGYNWIVIWLNTTCRDANMYDWSGTISDGKVSAVSTVLHEVGHALRIGHSNKSFVAMSEGGPGHCSPTGQRFSLAQDDLLAFRAAYPGLINEAIVLPTNAPCHA